MARRSQGGICFGLHLSPQNLPQPGGECRRAPGLLSAEPAKKCSVITAATAALGRCEEPIKEGAPAWQEAVCRRKHSTATWGRLEAPLTAFFLSGWL